ncbi:hypothetical protein SAY87_001434 [Trapa incisa]|uniref:RRM domain-containing protein n=1 Tax=Trapa incisa TaxID=236973 RepID=A0AAN7GNJ4_9MYRT|nr:hypothetical protein SAY87_001434 [Trapa incisa]
MSTSAAFPEAMQSDHGKLFIGGISWDTSEERLKEYFGAYGEVVEAIIMKDRTTGRARGFGFVVFADPAVAELVIKDKHIIDGRMVEAKRAVPRDDQNSLGRASSPSVHSSPGLGRTKKIFVGGLAATVTESNFKTYFEQFGTVNDVVVMYDHNTRRPRGFGFVTYDLEESVDKVLINTFHELNGKMVEVKRAVPKELSPGPSRSPLGGYNHGINRVTNLFSGYTQGYAPSAVGGYPLRDGRFSPVTGGRSGFPPFGMNFETGLGPSYEGTPNYSGSVSYARGMNPYYIGNPNRFSYAVGFDGGNGGNSSFFSSVTRNLWGNGGLNYSTNPANSTSYSPSGGTLSTGGATLFGNAGINWGSSQITGQGGGGGGNNVSNDSRNFGYGSGGNSTYGLGTVGYGRNAGSNAPALASSFSASNGAPYDGPFADLYGGGGSGYGDPTWRSPNNIERSAPGSFGYGLGAAGPEIPTKISPGYVGDYNVNKRVE